MIDDAELIPTGKLNEHGEEYFLLRENERLAYIRRNNTWPRVRFDGAGRSKESNYKESDPYKLVWNSMKDEEQELIERTRNGILFTPGYNDMARRFLSTARHLLREARKLGRTVAGIAAFEEAQKYQRLAQATVDAHNRGTRLSR